MRLETAGSSDRAPCLGRTLTNRPAVVSIPIAVAERLSPARPDVSRAPCGVRLLPATALQAPNREAPHELQTVRTRGRRCPQNPASPGNGLAPIAACFSYRLPLFKYRLAAASRSASRTADRTDSRMSLSVKSRSSRRVSAPRGVHLLSAPALQPPRREAPHEPQTVPTRGRRCPQNPARPDVSARLAACISYRLPLFKHRVARRLANRLTNRRLLATHATRPDYCKNHQKK